MKQLLFFSIMFLAACGDDPASVDNANFSNGFSGGPVLYPDDGVSNRLFSCEEAAQRIRDSFELGMTFAEVRAIAGKPRHISRVGNDWRYSAFFTVGAGPRPSDFFPPDEIYYLPVANFQTLGLDSQSGEVDVDANPFFRGTFMDDFSGDDRDCYRNPSDLADEQAEDLAFVEAEDLAFVEAANSYAQIAGTVDFSEEITACDDAAIRIAGSIEQGMSLQQVRQLVGKPLEVAQDGTLWRYGYPHEYTDDGYAPLPHVFFTQYILEGTYLVTGYSSVNIGCFAN